MSVLIVDYGIGNLASVARAFEECGARAVVSDQPAALARAERVVLPGVGAFGDAMQRLRATGWDGALRDAVLSDRLPLLGICLGMQLLADFGEEGGFHPGLGLVPGKVQRMNPQPGERIPHVGWNEAYPTADPLFDGLRPGGDFYFVHSFQFIPANEDNVIARSDYCGGFVSAVRAGSAWGVQFHPEKSSHNGFRLLRNFLGLGADSC